MVSQSSWPFGAAAPLMPQRCLRRLASRQLAAGAYTLLAAALLTATTAATSWLLHLSNGFFLNWSLESGVEHGYEFDLVRLGVLVCRILAGPGTLAYDTRRTRARRLHGRQKKG